MEILSSLRKGLGMAMLEIKYMPIFLTKDSNLRLSKLAAIKHLAFKFNYGIDVDQDSKAGFKWYLKAAKLGDIESELQVAQMLDDGDGVPISMYDAFSWYEKAARQGNAFAQYLVAMRYIDGLGTDCDLAKSIFWLQKAAGQGHADALTYMASLYYFGHMVEQDEVKAKKYWREADKKGSWQAETALEIVEEIQRIKAKGDNKDYEKIDSLVVELGELTIDITTKELFEKAARANFVRAMAKASTYRDDPKTHRSCPRHEACTVIEDDKGA